MDPTPDGSVSSIVSQADVAVPLSVVLRPVKRKLIRLLLLSAVLASPAGFDDSLAIRLSGGFFVLCAIVFLILLLPGAAYLRIDPDGFTCCSLFRTQTVAWADVNGFGVAVAGGRQMVGYNIIRNLPRYSRLGGISLAAVSEKLSGYRCALPDTYGLSAAELAGLMNHCRQLGLSGDGTAD